MNSKNNTHTCTNEDIEVVYNLVNYYKRIPNYATITTLPEKNAQYIKEALPNVNDCRYMMGNINDGCKALTSIDTTGWDTSNITDMNSMFANCNSLTTLDVSKFNTSKVTDMNSMFYYCNTLTTLDVSKWNTSKVTDMNNMFASCNALTTLDVSNWDTSKVTNMNWMFFNCTALTTITGIIDMKSCTSSANMFLFSNKLSGVKIKNPPADFETYSGITKDKYEIVF